MSISVRDLLSRHRSGDADAAPALARAYLPAVRALALAGTLDPAGAGEVTRKALVRFVRDLGEAPGASRLMPLAQAAAHAEIETWIRARGGRPTEIEAIPAELASRAKGATLELEAVFGDLPPDRAAAMLLEAAGWIPDHYEVTFLLRYMEGLTWAEIAELTGTTPREVGSALSAARKLYEREIAFRLRKMANP